MKSFFPSPPGNLRSADLAALAMATAESAPVAAVLHRTDGQALLYPAAFNTISSEPGHGKTWVGLAAVCQVLNSGGSAIIFDLEDVAPRIVGRLLALGATASGLTNCGYFNLAGPLGDAERGWLRDLLAAASVDLVLVDGVAAALAIEGLDENSAGDFLSWEKRFVRPLAASGAAVLCLDHLAKASDDRGRWARGTGAKLGAVDGAAYLLIPEIPFSRGGSGSARLVVAKDRHGAVGSVGEVAARVVFEVDGGELRGVRLLPGDGPASASASAERIGVEEVPQILAKSGGTWPSLKQASAALRLNDRQAREVLDAAEDAGLIIRVEGERYGSHAYRLPGLVNFEEQRRRLRT